MSKIIGLDNLTVEDVNKELANGARFVVFLYCFSLVIVTFKRSSNIHFIKAGYPALKVIRNIPLLESNNTVNLLPDNFKKIVIYVSPRQEAARLIFERGM